MCGVAGIWRDDDRVVAGRMLARLVHRGPDAAGLHVEPGHGVLGHQRLSIMDPTGGDQPLYNESGSLAVVANGEIYNYPRLRDELSGRHELRTGNDSEVLLHLFEDHGPAAAERLDGMFAFALSDGGDLFLARDPIGIKPLYLGRSRDDGPLYFASELKALAGLRDVAVSEFPAGSWYHTQHGLRSYYRVPRPAPAPGDLDEHASRLRATLEAAVAKRMMSDVPLGAFLSGGLDSSVICALARRHVAELHTFSVGLEGSPDILAAREVSRHLGTVHHEHLYTVDEVFEALPEILYHLESYDQDLVRSAIPCWFCSRLAARWVKVILTGEGADELFAGYAYYRDIVDPAALHRELRRSVTALHNVNLQRVDRLTMAHGLEGRVPFLDVDMIADGLAIPPELKLPPGAGPGHEKLVLRHACRDLLPDSILWRDKAQFDEGSGTVGLLEGELVRRLAGFDHPAYRREHSSARLRSAEEAWYHHLLSDIYDRSPVVLDNVARWTEREPDALVCAD